MAICDLSSRSKVFVGAGNLLKLIPLTNILTGARLDMTDATLVEVCVGTIEVDSDDTPTRISWAQETIDDVSEWVISIKAGLIASIPVGEQEMRVTVFGPAHADGLVVTHDLPLDVIAAC